MTLEQCKKRYQKATTKSSRARVCYDRLLKKLWFVLCTGDVVSAYDRCCILDFYGSDYRRVSQQSAGDPSAKIYVTVRKRSNKVTIAPADEAILAKADELFDAMIDTENEEIEWKLKLLDDFKLPIDVILDLRRYI